MQNKKLSRTFNAVIFALSMGCAANGVYYTVDGMTTGTAQDAHNAATCETKTAANQSCTTAEVKSLLTIRDAEQKDVAGIEFFLATTLLLGAARENRKKLTPKAATP